MRLRNVKVIPISLRIKQEKLSSSLLEIVRFQINFGDTLKIGFYYFPCVNANQNVLYSLSIWWQEDLQRKSDESQTGGWLGARVRLNQPKQPPHPLVTFSRFSLATPPVFSCWTSSWPSYYQQDIRWHSISSLFY